MELKGTVTEINQPLLYFILDDTVKVYMGILIAEGICTSLPTLRSTLEFECKNCNHQFGNTYFLCKNSRIHFQNGTDVNENCSFLLRLDHKNKLGVNDIITLDKFKEVLRKYFKDFTNSTDETSCFEVVISIMQNTQITPVDKMCVEENSKIFDFVTPSNSLYVDMKSDSYADFPYWTFGVHSSSPLTLLFGYLFVHPSYGFYFLRDDNHHILLKIFEECYDSSRIVNKYVLIKKYKIFTEIYKESNTENTEYIVVNFDDIHIVGSRFPEEETDLFCDILKSSLTETETHFLLDFQLINNSEPTIGDDKKPEYYLEILITNWNTRNVNILAFLVLPIDFIKIAALFTPNEYYKLFYTSLPTVHNNELAKLKPSHKIFKLSTSGTYFARNSHTHKSIESPSKLMDVRDCKEYIKKRNIHCCSFQGVLKCKKFTDPLSSHTKKLHKSNKFGTPGPKTHSLVFCQETGTGSVYLDCYITNWENRLMPVGLIPEMRLAVKNVHPQSGKYVKTGVFTRFEILSYEPKVEFVTTNLHYIDQHVDWGQHSYLGLGYLMPPQVLIWGRVFIKAIYDFKIISSCAKCNYINECKGPCLKCNGEERKLDVTIVLSVADHFGQTKVLVKNEKFLKVLFNISDNQFERFLGCFEELGQYVFDVTGKQSPQNTCPEREVFLNTLNNYFLTFNKCCMLFVDLKCRKISEEPNGKMWYCIDFLRSPY